MGDRAAYRPSGADLCPWRRTNGWGRGRKFAVMRFVLKRADALLSNSDFTRDTLVNLLGVDPGAVECVYPTVDENRFRPGLAGADLRAQIGLGEGQRVILSVGRLMRRKGFDNVVRSLPFLLQRGLDIHYVVIGIGEDFEHLRNLARELGLADRVHLLGHVSYEDLPRWYGVCDLFAMPNREIGGDTEGFGLVFLEAAAAGKPVVAGSAGGTGSAVVDGVTGLRIDGEQLDAIAWALFRLLSNPQEAGQMGQKGRERVLENYTSAPRRSVAPVGSARALPGTRAAESAGEPSPMG